MKRLSDSSEQVNGSIIKCFYRNVCSKVQNIHAKFVHNMQLLVHVMHSTMQTLDPQPVRNLRGGGCLPPPHPSPAPYRIAW